MTQTTRRLEDSRPHPLAAPPAIFLTSAGLASLWIGIEFVHLALWDTAFDLEIALPRLLRYFAWQVVLFEVLAVPVAILSLLVPVRRAFVPWAILALGSFAFAGQIVARLAHRSLGSDVLTLAILAGTVLLFCSLLALLALAGRLLPRSARRAWPLAGVVAWSLFFVLSMRASITPMDIGVVSQSDFTSLIHLPTLLWAFAGAALVVVVAQLALLPRAAVVTVLLGAVAAAVSRQQAVDLAPIDAATPRPDVILLVLDTVRGDHVGASRESQSLTPALDAIAAEGVRFARAYAGSNVTYHSMPSIVTSLSHVAIGNRFLPPEAKTLAEHLQDAGYATFGFSANPWVSAYFGYDQGFLYLRDSSRTPDYLITYLLKMAGRLVPGPVLSQNSIAFLTSAAGGFSNAIRRSAQ